MTKRPPYYEFRVGPCPQCGTPITWRSGADTPWYVKAAMFIGWWKHGRKQRLVPQHIQDLADELDLEEPAWYAGRDRQPSDGPLGGPGTHT